MKMYYCFALVTVTNIASEFHDKTHCHDDSICFHGPLDVDARFDTQIACKYAMTFAPSDNARSVDKMPCSRLSFSQDIDDKIFRM